MNLWDQLKLHEGHRNHLYKDTAGKLTIGVGHNIEDKGLSDAVIALILQEDIAEAVSELDRVFPQWRDLNEPRQQVLIDMMFNLGAPKLLTFHKFMAALLEQDYAKAADEMLDSKWADQVGSRAIRLSEMMRTGEHA